MDSLLHLDQQTMFLVDALLLVVFAVAFAFAGLGGKDRRYWADLVASNLVFALAFIIFSHHINGTPQALLLPDCLLVIGLGLRWKATRRFFGHGVSSVWFLALSFAMGLALLLSDLVGTGLIFGLTNAIIAAQIIAIIGAIAIERERLPSRWGLMAAYGVIAASTLLRVGQGLLLERGMDNLLPADFYLDVHLVAAAIHISASGAFSLSLAYERSVARLEDTALRDPLTGLYNRRSIERLGELQGKQAAPEDAALVLVDIDYFKHVNDNFGHAAGDEAIKRCAKLIRDSFAGDNLIIRAGGEEFIILLPGRDVDYAHGLAERFRRRTESDTLSFDGKSIKFTVSMGISHGKAGPRSFPRLLEAADRCLYRAKVAGRNRIAIDGAANASRLRDSDARRARNVIARTSIEGQAVGKAISVPSS